MGERGRASSACPFFFPVRLFGHSITIGRGSISTSSATSSPTCNQHGLGRSRGTGNHDYDFLRRWRTLKRSPPPASPSSKSALSTISAVKSGLKSCLKSRLKSDHSTHHQRIEAKHGLLLHHHHLLLLLQKLFLRKLLLKLLLLKSLLILGLLEVMVTYRKGLRRVVVETTHIWIQEGIYNTISLSCSQSSSRRSL